MGNGKSQSAISYMNEHSDQKFIYITPYLDEATRIKASCPALNFVEPQQTRRYGFSKLTHTHALIERGENITTTHQAFKNYSEATLNAIREHQYTLIIDENVDVLEVCDIHEDDIRIAVEAGYVKFEDSRYELIRDDYNGNAFREMFWFMRSRQIMRIDTEEGGQKCSLYYWALPPDLITSFKDVIILTYLFEGQSLHSFLKMYDLPYENIGIKRVPGGGYSFSKDELYTPDYVRHIRDMVKIVDQPRLNSIGDDYTALSKNWFGAHADEAVPQLKKNIDNLFKNIWKDSEAEERMWATYKTQKDSLKGKGYTNGFVVLNLKASNNYRNKRYLVYACNLFMNVNEKMFYTKNGITVDEDKYALSIMVQWIWRSAIRDGEEIYIYLPSSRMRKILNDWMDSLTEGGSADGVQAL